MSASSQSTETSWKDVARRVQRHRDATMAQIEGPFPELPVNQQGRVIGIPRKYLTPTEISITERDAGSLIASLSSGELSATSVVQAFLRRAAIAQKLVNCVNELLPERALSRAKELDDYYALHKKPMGPIGFVSWVGRTSPEDARILQILLAAGAVLYVRTTEPQGLMMVETINNLNGVTTNPHNRALAAGGSSGGESALQALLGSPLGLGSDIGGSVRSPAANCGTYGFKPTAGRIPGVGSAAYNLGCETIPATLGPMSPSPEALELCIKTVLASQPWKADPSLHQIPWRQVGTFLGADAGRKLTVGVMWDDGVVKPAPAVKRALEEVVDKLKKLPNVKVIEWKAYRHDACMEILVGLYTPDGGNACRDQIKRSGEPILPLIEWTFRDTPGIKTFDHQGLWELTIKREMFRSAYLQEWNTVAPDMDVILCPTTPTPAPPHNTSRYWGYTSIWNLLDYPAVAFPVTKVDPVRDAKDPHYKPRNDMDRHYYENHDPEKQKDAPVGLQLVARKLEDEKLLKVFKEIKAALGLPFVDCLADY